MSGFRLWGGVPYVELTRDSSASLLSFSTNRKLCNDESDDDREAGPEDSLLHEDAKKNELCPMRRGIAVAALVGL